MTDDPNSSAGIEAHNSLMLNSPPNMFISLDSPPMKHDLNSNNRVGIIHASLESDAIVAMDSPTKITKTQLMLS